MVDPAVPGGTPQPLDTPQAIRVEGLSKSFRIPTHRVDSIKERAVHPFSSRDYRVMQALKDVSFEIHQGEFFGIVGRNGSGKSTLLKLLASIYRPDSGRILMAGRLAPFIELGVGFNPELSARENVVLNGVMMGLTPQQARSKLGAVLEFAELEEFVDLKLKNYSSGMLVRLAFSLMMEVDADILLIDEVLAVGDAAFQQKCEDAFHEMKEGGKTIVLVTHGMEAVETYCHRALLIDDSRVQYIGDPAEVGRRYLDLNFRDASTVAERTVEGDEVRLVEAWTVDDEGERVENFEHGQWIHMRLQFEVRIDSPGLDLGFIVTNVDHVPVVQFGASVENDGKPIKVGDLIEIEVELGNAFAPGRHFVSCGVNRKLGGIAAYVENALEFVIYGGPGTRGLVYLPHEVSTKVRPAGPR
jgi:ABC-type polysaccharide/polyol phosphate transport system ATPase subunit